MLLISSRDILKALALLIPLKIFVIMFSGHCIVMGLLIMPNQPQKSAKLNQITQTLLYVSYLFF